MFNILLHKVSRRYLFSLYTLCCVLTCLLCMYSINSNRWYGAETFRQATATDARVAGGLSISPWYTCARSSEVWRCEEFVLSGLAGTAQCEERSKSYVQGWTYAVRTFVILTGGFMAAGAVLSSGFSAMGPSYARTGNIVMLVFAVLALISNIIGIGVSVTFYKYKLYCDNGFCNILTNGDVTIDCNQKHFSGALAFYVGLLVPIVAVLDSMLLVFIADKVITAQPPPKTKAAVTVVTGGENEPIDTSTVPLPHGDQNSNAPVAIVATTASRGFEAVLAGLEDVGKIGKASESQSAEPPVTFQPPEGDWEWDPNSNMYWSESQYLFLNPGDGHFFDPNSEQWYNPETEQWSTTNQ